MQTRAEASGMGPELRRATNPQIPMQRSDFGQVSPLSELQSPVLKKARVGPTRAGSFQPWTVQAAPGAGAAPGGEVAGHSAGAGAGAQQQLWP